MKIAIATNDRKTLAERTGQAKEFALIELENEKIKNIEYRENSHHNHDHSNEEKEHTHKDIIEILNGVDIFYVLRVGKYLKRDLEQGNINYKIVKEKNIDNLISNL